jgi:hypothetical protein
VLARDLAYHRRARLEAVLGRMLDEVDRQIEELRREEGRGWQRRLVDCERSAPTRIYSINLAQAPRVESSPGDCWVNVLVVGAGPAGATTALLLARYGIDVTLVERETSFERVFRSEGLMPLGIDALFQMGLWGGRRRPHGLRRG